MWYIQATILAVGIIALLAQAALCLFTPRRPFSIGIVNLVVAAGLSFLIIEVNSGQLVVAADLGAFLVRAGWPAWMLQLKLICAASIPGLCWYRIFKLNQAEANPEVKRR